MRRVPQGDPAPDVIPASAQIQLELAFRPVVAVAAGESVDAAESIFGDVQRVDVGVTMDGKEVSGLSAVFAPAETGQKVFLPLVAR